MTTKASEIEGIALDDPTVHTYLRYFQMGAISWTEMLEILVVQLAKEKKILHDHHLNRAQYDISAFLNARYIEGER